MADGTPLPVWRWRLAALGSALWWASLLALGAWVVPTLFAHLGSPALAGAAAARLFSVQTWVSVACAVAILLAGTRRDGEQPLPGWSTASMAVVGGLLCALLIEFAIAPRIVAREQLALWHRVGTGLFVVQWVCAVVAHVKLVQPPRPHQP